MSARRPVRRRLPAAWLRRLGLGERLMAIVMLAILAGGFGLIGQGVWLKMTDAEPGIAHSLSHGSNHGTERIILR